MVYMAKPSTIRKGPPGPPRLKRLSIRARRWWSGFGLRRRKRAWRRKHARPAEKTVCFILGCQRSGTNMLIRTLDRMLEVDRFDEDDSRAFAGNRIKPKAVRDRLIAASDAACVIFKPICDSHRARELLRDHPGAKIIWIYRRFSDVAASAVHYWGDMSRLFMTDLLAGGGDWNEYQWNREGVTDEALTPLRAAISATTPGAANNHPGAAPRTLGDTAHTPGTPTADAAMSDADAGCLFWHLRNALFFSQELQSHRDTLLIRYETLVSDPPTGFAKLCSFLNLQFDPAAVASVHKESVGRGAQNKITPGVYRVCESLLARLDAAAGETHRGSAVAAAK